jgi:HAD superfamily hydrolase (TIGR01509 family)
MIKAIIFDCFGVLVSDALQVIHDELYAKDPAAAAEIRGLVRGSNRGILDSQTSNQRIAEILGIDFAAYQRRIQDGEIKDLRMLDLARQLHQKYKTAILSNISATGLKKRFTEQELTDCFDAVVASAEIGHAKPELQAYTITAERLGVQPEECIFTDDRTDFCEAAKRAGMRAIVYENFEQFKTDIEQELAGDTQLQ